jgi:hypothetical protein
VHLGPECDQAATNVDSAYINRAVKVLLQEDSTLMQLEGGDLITEAYLDAALEALSQSLETSVRIGACRDFCRLDFLPCSSVAGPSIHW